MAGVKDIKGLLPTAHNSVKMAMIIMIISLGYNSFSHSKHARNLVQLHKMLECVIIIMILYSVSWYQIRIY